MCTRWGAYVVALEQVIPILNYFIKLTLSVAHPTPQNTLIQDNARMEAQRLIELFNREVFGKTDSENNVQEKSNDTEEDSSMEPIQLFKPTDKPTNVPVVAVKDIENIGELAMATVKVFRVAEKDALRAVTKLKAEEINRDLSPLLELLA